MPLVSVYGSLKGVTRNLETKTVNKEFLDKEKQNIKERNMEGSKEKKSMVMSSAIYHKEFSL